MQGYIGIPTYPMGGSSSADEQSVRRRCCRARSAPRDSGPASHNVQQQPLPLQLNLPGGAATCRGWGTVVTGVASGGWGQMEREGGVGLIG